MYHNVQATPEMYAKVAIEAFKALLCNSALIEKLNAEDQAAIEANEDFIPVEAKIADLALEYTEAFLPLLDRGLSENFPS
ncbi:hypothetical protein H6F89_11445 [Cyanobacteria bacterium FACHB-63]|nr:hypothetical protein [Cyanobacteria bacterium FACHB-63]